MPNFRKLGAPPPLASGSWGLRHQIPKHSHATRSPIANFWLRACQHRIQLHKTINSNTYTSNSQPVVRVVLVIREGLSGGTRVDYFLKVNFLFSVCNILLQLVQHSLKFLLLQVIISAFRVYCRARYLINCAKPDIWYCGS